MEKDLQHLSACGMHFPITLRGNQQNFSGRNAVRHSSSAGDEPCMLTSFGSQILLSNQNWPSLCMIKTN